MNPEMTHILSTEILAELEIGVNMALGLDKTHDFGSHFVIDYIDSPVTFHVDPEWKKPYTLHSTDYVAMREWCDRLGFMWSESLTWKRAFDRVAPKRFNLTEKQHAILISILGIIQALLDVKLIHEGKGK